MCTFFANIYACDECTRAFQIYSDMEEQCYGEWLRQNPDAGTSNFAYASGLKDGAKRALRTYSDTVAKIHPERNSVLSEWKKINKCLQKNIDNNSNQE